MTNLDTLLDDLSADAAQPVGDHRLRFGWPLLTVAALCGIGVTMALDGAFATIARDGTGPMAIKWGFSLSLLALAVSTLIVFGKPGRPWRVAMWVVAVPFVPILALLVLETIIAGPRVYGDTWVQCLTAMLVMSPIAFAGAIFATRALAPVNLRRAGLVAGLFGGAVAMTAYSPFCPERGMGYVAVFYILPILAMAGVGWLAGPKLLRW
ncbi:MAG: DUF1109 domain-containing protein [Alteraurantiacibacter sp.]